MHGAMSDLLTNALNSIQLGIEDYQSNDLRRPVSAVRNFYAGVLLLGKQCLLNEAPDADPMEVLGSRFAPKPDGKGGVVHEPEGHQTIDLGQLRRRFQDFGLRWPNGDVNSLQRVRNDLEHFHSPAPHQALRQAIADCFPLVEGFFALLEVDPCEALGSAWEIMLSEERFFSEQKLTCDATWKQLPWSENIDKLKKIACPKCGSSLIYQEDSLNGDPAMIQGKCKACGARFGEEETITLLLEAQYGDDDYVAMTDGGDPIVGDCPECGSHTYVHDPEGPSLCFWCDFTISGDCWRCNAQLTPQNTSVNDSSMCDYCYWMTNKDD